MSQGMDGYGDGYEVVLENNPSVTEVIKQQSLNMSNINWTVCITDIVFVCV
ncbi:hypothetical protein MTR_1g083295 [Medicago truncatula]|uniref:Uncharacterized protein n=1 Tax=Medicago truncatula TaxID=3880 RepID=A0A072VNT8_MEDTR|nr:hypothetical protein MTR_1g083295 [Medicago truncatula]